MASVAIIVGIGALCTVNIIIPNTKYSNAVAAMETGDYRKAAEVFATIPTVKDSASLLDQCSIKILENAKVGEKIIISCYGTPYSWTVIAKEGTGALIVADEAVVERSYHNKSGGITEGTAEFDYNLWANCELRTWLNSTFLQSAFTPGVQNAICSTNVVNNVKLTYDRNGGANTNDKVFILSWGEARDYKVPDSQTSYWLRSPAGTNGRYASIAQNGRSWGSVSNKQDASITSAGIGVRPAMWINSEEPTHGYMVSSTTGTEAYKPVSSGSTNSTQQVTCTMCNGTGKVKYYYGGSATEAALAGKSDYEYGPCSSCNGTGKVAVKTSGSPSAGSVICGSCGKYVSNVITKKDKAGESRTWCASCWASYNAIMGN